MQQTRHLWGGGQVAAFSVFGPRCNNGSESKFPEKELSRTNGHLFFELVSPGREFEEKLED